MRKIIKVKDLTERRLGIKKDEQSLINFFVFINKITVFCYSLDDLKKEFSNYQVLNFSRRGKNIEIFLK